jgi:hypothetical protein
VSLAPKVQQALSARKVRKAKPAFKASMVSLAFKVRKATPESSDRRDLRERLV